MRNGKFGMLGGSRAYIHDLDRTLAAREYGFLQGWAEDQDLSTVHLPVPLIKHLLKTNKKGSNKKSVSLEDAPMTSPVAEGKAVAKKKKRKPPVTTAPPTTAPPKRAATSSARGPQPHFNKSVQLYGNSCALHDMNAVFYPMLLTLPPSSGVWERLPEAGGAE